MTVVDIINLARTLSYTNASDASDEKVLLAINTVYNELYGAFCALHRGAYEEIYIADLEASRTKYPLPEQNAEQNGLRSVSRVYLLGANGEYVATREINWDTWEQYQNGKTLSVQDPCFVNLGEYFLVGPESSFTQSDGLKIVGPKKLRPLLLTSTSDDIFLPEEAHSLLAYGSSAFLFSLRGMQAEKDRATREYAGKKEAYLSAHAYEMAGTTSAQLPSLARFQ